MQNSKFSNNLLSLLLILLLVLLTLPCILSNVSLSTNGSCVPGTISQLLFGRVFFFFETVGLYWYDGLFFYMFLSGIYGEVSHISVKFVTFLLFIFLGNSRMDFFYKQKYYGLKINSEISLSEINITKRLWYICRIGKYLSLICVVILAFVLLF